MTPPFCDVTGKIRFKCAKDAMEALARDPKAKNVHAFYCHECKAYHLGHEPGSRKGQRRKCERKKRRTNRKGLPDGWR